MEVVLRGIWVTNVRGSPSYTPCKHCRTKIDASAQACKKKAEGCASTPNDEVMLSGFTRLPSAPLKCNIVQ